GAGADTQLLETVGMFVSNALSSLTDLEEELLSVESAGDRVGDIVASIRRTVHTLKAEFGVLNMLAPQALCHQAETTIDAIVEHGKVFPVDALLAFGDLIKQFVERLAVDVKAEFGDPEAMLATLRELATNAERGVGADAERVELAAASRAAKVLATDVAASGPAPVPSVAPQVTSNGKTHERRLGASTQVVTP